MSLWLRGRRRGGVERWERGVVEGEVEQWGRGEMAEMDGGAAT